MPAFPTVVPRDELMREFQQTADRKIASLTPTTMPDRAEAFSIGQESPPQPAAQPQPDAYVQDDTWYQNGPQAPVGASGASQASPAQAFADYADSRIAGLDAAEQFAQHADGRIASLSDSRPDDPDEAGRYAEARPSSDPTQARIGPQTGQERRAGTLPDFTPSDLVSPGAAIGKVRDWAANGGQGALAKAATDTATAGLTELNRPQSAVGRSITNAAMRGEGWDPFHNERQRQDIREGWQNPSQRTTADVVQATGADPLASQAAGLLFDVASDPLNVVDPGNVGIAAAGMVKTASKLPKVSHPAVDALTEMYTKAPIEPRKSTSGLVGNFVDGAVRALWDRKVGISQAQEHVAEASGRALADAEMPYELSMRNSDGIAKQQIDEELKPVLQSMQGEDRAQLSAYMTLQHNVDVAKAMGQKAADEMLQTPLAPTKAEGAVKSYQAQAQVLTRNRAAAQTAGDAAKVADYDARIAEANRKLNLAQKRAVRQTTAADANRSLAAKTRGNQIAEERVFSGGIDKMASEEGLQAFRDQLTPEQLQSLDGAAQKVYAFNQGRLTRLRDSGVVSQELFDDLVRRYPHYSPTQIVDHLVAEVDGANRMAGGKSLSVRDNGLRRLSEEGTAKARLDPLFSSAMNAYKVEAIATRNETARAIVDTLTRDPKYASNIRKVGNGFTKTKDEVPMVLFRDGEKETYAVDKDTAALVGAAEVWHMPDWWNAGMAAWRSLLTSRNPLFLTGNASLDAMNYALRESARLGGPQHLPEIMVELARAYGDAFGGLLSGTYRGDTARYLKAGGAMFGHGRVEPRASVAQTVKDSQKYLDDLTRGSAITVDDPSDWLRILKDIAKLEPVQAIGERIELAPRVAAMRLAEKRGASPLQAMKAGRTVTIDFQQGGAAAKAINQVIPFFNVAMQGMAVPVRMFRENPKGATLAIAMLAAPTVGFEAWNRADPQRSRDYDDVPQYIKDQGLVFMLPGEAPIDAQGNRHPQFIHVRLREFAPIAIVGREALNVVQKRDPRALSEVLLAMYNSASPIPAGNAADTFSSIVPPIASEGLQIAANKDFYRGSMIATERKDDQASAFSKAGSGLLGGQPSQWDFAAKSLGGGPGQMVLEASDLVAGRDNPRAAGPSGVPIIGGALKRFVRGDTGQTLDTAQASTFSPEAQRILKEGGVNLAISPVRGEIKGAPLTMAEQAELQKRTNELVDQAIHWQSEQPSWTKNTRSAREERIRSLIAQARAQAALEAEKRIGGKVLSRRWDEAHAGD